MTPTELEPGSIFSPDLAPESGVRGIVRLVGWKHWKRRFDILQREFDAFPAGRQSLVERHHVELCVFSAYERLRLRFRLREAVQPDLDAYLFSAVVMKLHSLLSPTGKRRLAGKVSEALSNDFGFAALRTELTAIWFLHDLGCRVVPIDLERLGTCDFMAKRNQESIELECKLLTLDFAQYIRSSAFRRRHRYFAELCDVVGFETNASVIVRIVAASGLPRGDGELREIAALIGRAIRGAADRDGLARFGLTIELEAWPLGAEQPDLVHSEARWLTVVEGWSTFAVERADAAVIVAIRGVPESAAKIEDRFVRKFKAAADQMSGTCEGVVFAEVEGPCLDKPVMLEIRKVFECIMPSFFSARPFVKLIILGFPGPPFSAGAAYNIRTPHWSTEVQSELLRELCDLAVTESGPPLPGWEFRKSWFERKYRWDHKTEEDLDRSLARRYGVRDEE